MKFHNGPAMEKRPACSAERRHVLTYTPTYTAYPLGCTLSPSLALSHCIHTQEHTRETVSIFIQELEWYLQQNSWMNSHLKYNMLLNCIKSYRSVPYFKLLVCVYKLKLTIAKCLLPPLHARTQPEPATRAHDQSMDQPSILKIAPIPFWHITITMKQHAICFSWISQTLNIEFTIVKPIIWSIGLHKLRGIIIKPDNYRYNVSLVL